MYFLSIRNLWSLEPGECLVAQKLMTGVKDCQVFFPLRDIGIDLLVGRNEKYVGIQVKESRYYEASRPWPDGHTGHSWHQLKKKSLQKNNGVNFYVFLTYIPEMGEHKVSSFEKRYIIVQTEEVAERAKTKRDSSGVLSFCFHFDKDRNDVHDERVNKGTPRERTDYTPFLDKWELIGEAIG